MTTIQLNKKIEVSITPYRQFYFEIFKNGKQKIAFGMTPEEYKKFIKLVNGMKIYLKTEVR